MTDELRTLDSYREEIERSPGKLVFQSKGRAPFRPFYRTRDGSWSGLEENGLETQGSGNWVGWRLVKPTVVRWLWADKYGNVSPMLLDEKEMNIKKHWTIKLEWSRTEFPAEENDR